MGAHGAIDGPQEFGEPTQSTASATHEECHIRVS
jgi:hypothetical protein